MKPLVIYHADCTDGYGAAFAAWMKLGDEAEYLPMQYGQAKLHEALPFNPLNRDVYILDFSFERQIMEFIFRDAKRVVWVDHHKTAFEMAGLGYEKGMTSACHHLADPARHHVRLDDNKSGALLAWEYFHPGTEVPILIQHIDDRDRWQFKMEGSRELHAALSSYKPWSFEQWRGRFLPSFDKDLNMPGWTLDEGAAILRAQDQHVKSMAKQARKCGIPPTVKIAGCYAPGTVFEPLLGLAVNASLHQSEVGHELANQSGTFGLVWHMGADSRIKVSLRSNGDYDVSAIARTFGGGGHKAASGFTIDIQTLLSWMK